MGITSLIVHPPKMAILLIRQDYIGICQDAPDAVCAASILSIFTFWMDWKAANIPQAEIHNALVAKANAEKSEGDTPEALQVADLWVYKSMPDLKEDCFGMYGETKLTQNRIFLEQKGFLLTRDNPYSKWNRTKQYHINIQLVQLSINEWYESAIYMPYIQGIETSDTRLRSDEIKDSNHPLNGIEDLDSGNDSQRELSEEESESQIKEHDKPAAPDFELDKKAINKKVKAMQAIHWDHLLKVIGNTALSQTSFCARTNKDFKGIAVHDLDITAKEYAAYLLYLLNSDWYKKNKQFPSPHTVARKIHLFVERVRAGDTYGTIDESTPIHESEFGNKG